METKQTAVEWLEEKVDNMILNGGDTDLLAVIEHIKQAKAMEIKQIREAYYKGVRDDDILAEAYRRYPHVNVGYMRLEDNSNLQIAFRRGAEWARAKLNDI